MRFKVDQDKCVACGACGSTCPEVFKVDELKSNVILDPVPEALQALALSAEEGCPVQAISHEE